LHFLGSPRSDYNDLLAAVGTGDQLFEAALSSLSRLPADRWTHCLLENVPGDSMIGRAWRRISPRLRCRIERRQACLCPGAVLEVESQRLAYHLGFEFDGRFSWYKPAFGVNLWEFSPGEVLLRHLFKYARDHRLREFDFTRGDERFKSRFANRVGKNYTLHF